MQKNIVNEENVPTLSIKARQMLLRAKIYRFFAYFAAICGFAVSMIIYSTVSGGNYQILLERPLLLIHIVVPFIPCSIVSIIAHKHKKAFHDQAQAEGFNPEALSHRNFTHARKGVKQN